MTEMHSNFKEESADFSHTETEPQVSPLRAALARAAAKRFRASRIARDAAIIEALGNSVKSPVGYGDDFADNVWRISDMLKGYGLDVSVRIETVLVPRGHATAWRQREAANAIEIFMEE